VPRALLFALGVEHGQLQRPGRVARERGLQHLSRDLSAADGVVRPDRLPVHHREDERELGAAAGDAEGEGLVEDCVVAVFVHPGLLLLAPVLHFAVGVAPEETRAPAVSGAQLRGSSGTSGHRLC